jgi:hypothetical protein
MKAMSTIRHNPSVGGAHTHEPRRPKHTVLNTGLNKVIPHPSHAILPARRRGAAAQYKALGAFFPGEIDELDHRQPWLRDLRFHHVYSIDASFLEWCYPARLIDPIELDGRIAFWCGIRAAARSYQEVDVGIFEQSCDSRRCLASATKEEDRHFKVWY